VIERVPADNFGVYGARKIHAELHRQGHSVARCTVQRLMRVAGLRGLSRAKGLRTTIPRAGPDLRPDLVERAFTATGPDQLWVADIAYCRTFAGWVYAAFVTDVYSRRVVGWQLSKSLRTDQALDALGDGHLDPPPRRARRGGADSPLRQGRATRCRALHPAPRRGGRGRSVGSTGDSYDNAVAEAFDSPVQGRAGSQQRPVEGHRRLQRSPSPNTSTGSTTDACTARSG
jgi:putative transposase